jgi:hypothetical protein
VEIARTKAESETTGGVNKVKITIEANDVLLTIDEAKKRLKESHIAFLERKIEFTQAHIEDVVATDNRFGKFMIDYEYFD